MAKFQKVLQTLKETNQDFEWYPTTDTILEIIKNDIDEHFKDAPSVLDCGAGDGRALDALTSGKRYAIEKAVPLLHQLDKDIFVVGTDFEGQSILDKHVDVIFSNPPYSQYEAWAHKIIKEANCCKIYLVVPSRWKDSSLIQEAMSLRETGFTVIGQTDFLDAERAARCSVDIVRFDLTYGGWNSKNLKTNPFRVWFNEYFKFDGEEDSVSESAIQGTKRDVIKTRLEKALVSGENLMETLQALYRKELDELIALYQSLSQVNPMLLKELDINVTSVSEGLELKIKSLKDRYWHELFEHLGCITSRLTKKSREKLLSTLTSHTHVDFTIENAKAIVTWVIKNANQYYDDQLINLVERMVEKANIQLYVSNQKTYGNDEWRYYRYPESLERYALEYRIVLTRIGGIYGNGWYDRNHQGLCESAFDFINDICTLGQNLGYDREGLETASDYEWEPNQRRRFHFRKNGEREILFEVRAFKNGNLHIRFSKDFILRLNVEFGRLKGWLKSPKEASDELQVNLAITNQYFESNYQLSEVGFPLINHLDAA